MSADSITVYKDRIEGRRVWIIKCPGCANFKYERPGKRMAVQFATTHSHTHEGMKVVVR